MHDSRLHRGLFLIWTNSVDLWALCVAGPKGSKIQLILSLLFFLTYFSFGFDFSLDGVALRLGSFRAAAPSLLWRILLIPQRSTSLRLWLGFRGWLTLFILPIFLRNPLRILKAHGVEILQLSPWLGLFLLYFLFRHLLVANRGNWLLPSFNVNATVFLRNVRIRLVLVRKRSAFREVLADLRTMTLRLVDDIWGCLLDVGLLTHLWPVGFANRGVICRVGVDRWMDTLLRSWLRSQGSCPYYLTVYVHVMLHRQSVSRRRWNPWKVRGFLVLPRQPCALTILNFLPVREDFAVTLARRVILVLQGIPAWGIVVGASVVSNVEVFVLNLWWAPRLS